MIAYYFVYLEHELAAIFYILSKPPSYQAELKVAVETVTEERKPSS